MPITIFRSIIELFTGLAEIRGSAVFRYNYQIVLPTLSSHWFLLKKLPAWNSFLCDWAGNLREGLGKKIRNPKLTICKALTR